MPKIGLIGLCICVVTQVFAQQQAIYSQYIFNLYVINPAYAGTREALSVNGSYRAQWVGFEGAPTTQNFSINGPLRKQNMGLGLQFQNDVIGARRATSVSGTYSYQIKLSNKQKLSFGLQGDLINYSLDWEKLTYGEQNDPVAYSIKPNRYIPNFDFGFMYLTPNSYLGFSAYNLLQSSLTDNIISDSRLRRQLHLMGGKVFSLSKDICLKPGFLGRYSIGGPAQFDRSTLIP